MLTEAFLLQLDENNDSAIISGFVIRFFKSTSVFT